MEIARRALKYEFIIVYYIEKTYIVIDQKVAAEMQVLYILQESKPSKTCIVVSGMKNIGEMKNLQPIEVEE